MSSTAKVVLGSARRCDFSAFIDPVDCRPVHRIGGAIGSRSVRVSSAAEMMKEDWAIRYAACAALAGEDVVKYRSRIDPAALLQEEEPRGAGARSGGVLPAARVLVYFLGNLGFTEQVVECQPRALRSLDWQVADLYRRLAHP